MQHKAPPKLVILDRDGTINADSDEYIKSADEWVPLPGALQAISRLNHAGYQVVVASNQSGIGRGLMDMAALNAIHAKMHHALSAVGGRIDAVFFCPHAPEQQCACRKPKPGMLFEIGERLGVDLSEVPMVGDSLRDMQAAHAAGCQPHWVCTGKSEHLRSDSVPAQAPEGTRMHDDLSAFVTALLGEH